MARETKEDRFVRKIFEQTIEFMVELKQLEAMENAKESHVERWCQGFIRSCLGFTSSLGYQVRAQEGSGKLRPDLLIYKNEEQIPLIIVEVKRLSANLDKSEFRSGKTQLTAYLEGLGNVRWGILTNGYEWRLYDFHNNAIQIATLDLRGDNNQIDADKKGAEEAAWNLLDFSVMYFESEDWDKMSQEALAFSPDSLAKASLSFEVLKKVAQVIKGEHDFKAPIEVIADNMKRLVVNGLNDCIPGWNDTLENELDHYIRSQKRKSRQTRRTSKKQSTEVNSNEALRVENDANTSETSTVQPDDMVPNNVKKIA